MILSKLEIGAFCGILCSGMYVLFTLLAMRVFPGGFDVVWGYLSTLGVTETAAGIPSPLNFLLYATACTGAAVLSIPFWLTLHRAFPEPRRARHTSLIGTIFGVAAAPFIALAGLTPGNLMIDLHRLVSIFFFLFYTFAVLVYSYAIILSKDIGNRYAVTGILAFTFCFLHIAGPLVGLPQIQKVAVYSLFLWPLFQGTKLLGLFRITPGQVSLPSLSIKPLLKPFQLAWIRRFPSPIS